jgi:hypothetical protein
MPLLLYIFTAPLNYANKTGHFIVDCIIMLLSSAIAKWEIQFFQV